MKMKTVITIVAITLLTTTLAFAEKLKVGDMFPDITLPNVQSGEAEKVLDLIRGKVSVILYMQTSCGACMKEEKDLKRMLERAPDLNVIAISVDRGSSRKVQRYLKRYDFPFTFLHDTSYATPELFGFLFTPGTVVVDGEGKIFYIQSGYRTGEELRRNIFEKLGTPASEAVSETP